MDFEWSDDQLALRDSVIKFVARELTDGAKKEAFSLDHWRRCAELGIQGLSVPEEYGGQGASVLTTIAALEALGYACADNGLLFSLNAHMWAVVHPIRTFGNAAQKTRYLPGLCNGSLIGAHAMSEPKFRASIAPANGP